MPQTPASDKTLYIVAGIEGLQAYSTRVVTGHLVHELTQLGWHCKPVLMQAETPRNKLQLWVLQAWTRYIHYPRKCASEIPANSLVYITDHANAGIVAKLKRGCKVLVHMHDALSMRPPWDFPYKVRPRNLLIWLLSYLGKRQGLRRADRFITVSSFSKQEIQQYLGVPANRIRVAYNGVSIDLKTLPSIAQCRADLSIDEHLFVITTVGPASLRKNYQVIADALTQLNNLSAPILWLHIGSMESTIVTAITQLEHCELRVETHIAETKTAYRAANVLISASRYEGFGLPPIEAIRCGCPVLAANIPAARETLGKHARFFGVDDAGQLAHELSHMISGHGHRADQEWAGRYSWRSAAAIVDEELSLLEEYLP